MTNSILIIYTKQGIQNNITLVILTVQESYKSTNILFTFSNAFLRNIYLYRRQNSLTLSLQSRIYLHTDNNFKIMFFYISSFRPNMFRELFQMFQAEKIHYGTSNVLLIF